MQSFGDVRHPPARIPEAFRGSLATSFLASVTVNSCDRRPQRVMGLTASTLTATETMLYVVCQGRQLEPPASDTVSKREAASA
ncbi:hypothetical protein FOMPIDRAFT_1021459 [Fomitopsis schrenkii]|uniref:Uncharacterized protein n=1 Tax=Fomitopsis schrenkii TaxID=2126942 RepID=S8FVC3_FOMSC|nr:hypothetical protein FOMPIDRAFT_1021459 [Fomitopsis schrenkii]